jgi:predicted nucleic acid-binding protein
MKHKPRLFLDTSALFAGIWSHEGGARMLLKLGEAGVVELLVSSQVLDEIEDVITRKAPHLLAKFILLLDRSQTSVVPTASVASLNRCLTLVQHQGEGRILADAYENQADYLVTLDRAHFLGAEGLSEQVPLIIGTPGDSLAWLKRIVQGLG